MIKNSLFAILISSSLLAYAETPKWDLLSNSSALNEKEDEIKGASFLTFVSNMAPNAYFKFFKWVNEVEVEWHCRIPYNQISAQNAPHLKYRQGESLTSEIQVGEKKFTFFPHGSTPASSDLKLFLGILPSDKIVSFIKSDVRYATDSLPKILKGEGRLKLISIVEDHELKTISKELDLVQVETPDNKPLPLDKIRQGVDAMDAALAVAQHVYVHCKSGVGRSATIIAAWYMKHFHMTAEEAADFVRERRPEVAIGRVGHYHQRALERFERFLKKLKDDI